MATSISVDSPQGIPRSRKWIFILPWALVLLLAVANIGTLVNARIHMVGFDAVQTVLGSFGAQAAESLLSQSVSRIAERERQVIAAQKKLARNVALRSARRLAAHASESIATLAGRVIPYLGAAAVVGMTAYDVRNDCETVRDMNELLSALTAEPVESGQVCQFVDRVPSLADVWSGAKDRAIGGQRRFMDVLERRHAEK